MHETFTKLDHTLGHNTNLNIFKGMEIQIMLFDYDVIKLEISHIT